MMKNECMCHSPVDKAVLPFQSGLVNKDDAVSEVLSPANINIILMSYCQDVWIYSFIFTSSAQHDMHESAVKPFKRWLVWDVPLPFADLTISFWPVLTGFAWNGDGRRICVIFIWYYYIIIIERIMYVCMYDRVKRVRSPAWTHFPLLKKWDDPCILPLWPCSLCVRMCVCVCVRASLCTWQLMIQYM